MIPSPSSSVKIQIVCRKVCFRCKQKVCGITQQCFALLSQVNFPAKNLNFYWRWRWCNQIQAIFLNIFYFKWKIEKCFIANFESKLGSAMKTLSKSNSHWNYWNENKRTTSGQKVWSILRLHKYYSLNGTISLCKRVKLCDQTNKWALNNDSTQTGFLWRSKLYNGEFFYCAVIYS